jgi:ribosome-associated toxin RatA of RatAB toxin-antitoxin module
MARPTGSDSVTRIQRSALVARPAARMFALVADVERYPQRFRWCTGARVEPQADATVIARLDLRFAGVAASFATRNRNQPDSRIDLALVEGPFRSLGGAWTFAALGDAGCRIALQLDFEFAGRFVGSALASGFQGLADRMVDEFVRVAQAEPA